MNEEKQIRYSKYLVISFALIAVLIIFFKLFCGGTSGNNNDVQGTVQRIADDNKQTGKSVDRAIEHVGTATDELGRADEANRRAAFILSEDKDRINTCAEIINRLQRNNSRAKQILADVERANQEAE
ncbi:hypothetical protein [Phascolarctobacterium faecium]|uniref:hypothetical protein n=2 Tax=Phascolarctobacterium faecium TaxID=33025 RepID=UPI003AEFA783